jgi:hypothetical protein
MLINDEERCLRELKSTYALLKKRHKPLYEDFLQKDFDPDSNFSEYHLMNAFNKQASLNEKTAEVAQEIKRLEQSILTKQESIKSLSGALLQIAKQGLSLVHGKLSDCPNGRSINGEFIKVIIWQGRNQSLHFEDGHFRKPVEQCFKKINIPLEKKNLAKEIIDLLGWRNYKQYESDLMLLLQP